MGHFQFTRLVTCRLLFLLQSEVKDLKKRLRNAEDDFKKSQTDTSKYYSTLKDIFVKVSPIVQKSEKTDNDSVSTMKKEEVSSPIKREVSGADESSLNGQGESLKREESETKEEK